MFYWEVNKQVIRIFLKKWFLSSEGDDRNHFGFVRLKIICKEAIKNGKDKCMSSFTSNVAPVFRQQQLLNFPPSTKKGLSKKESLLISSF